ncbi:MAG: right-handed parallel beta-helix repeat-containing protein [Paludibacter sp.]
MKKLIIILIVLIPLFQVIKAALPELGWGSVITTGLNLYVSTTGADTNDGSMNTPFKTVAKAQTYIRTLKTTTGLPLNGITVWIRGGRYQMSPLAFTSADNGTVDKPIIYRAYNNESVSLFTGKQINPTDWKPLSATARLRVNPKINPDSLREIDVTAMAVQNTNPFADSFTTTWSIFDFVVNNQRQPVSQWPNLNENIRGLNDPGWTTCNGSKNVQTFYYGPGGKPTDGNSSNELDLDGSNRAERWRSSIASGYNLWLKGFWRVPWSPITVRVAEVNTTGNWIKLAVNASGGMGSKYTANADVAGTYRVGDGKEKWCAINYLDEIDSAGEWAFDFKDKKVYYYPSTDLSKVVSYFADNSLPVIKCTSVSYLRFIGLTIEGGQGNGFDFTTCSNLLVGGCTIRNVGANGINDSGGSNNTYQGNNIYETGAIAINLANCGNRLTLTSSNISILNNHIHHTGKLVSGFAIKMDQCVGVSLAHNLIHDIPAGGVTTNLIVNCTFEYNEIHNIALKESDNGGFYNYGGWTCYGNEIRYNFLHHINRSNGLYTDDGTSGFNYYYNIVQSSLNPVLTGGGHHVIVRNCMFVDGLKTASIDDRGISRFYFVSSASYGGRVRAINPKSEPWLSFGKQMMTKYSYAANDTLWGCTLDSLWHPEYPNGSKMIDNVEIYSKGFSKPTHGTVTVANNVAITTDAGAGFYDYANMDLRSNNTTILGKFPVLNTAFPIMGLTLDDYRVRVVTHAEVGGLANRGASGDPWAEDPIHP